MAQRHDETARRLRMGGRKSGALERLPGLRPSLRPSFRTQQVLRRRKSPAATLYLLNKFRDDAKLREKPKSPRRVTRARTRYDAARPDEWVGAPPNSPASQTARPVNEGTPTAPFWKQGWFPKTDRLFRQGRTYRNQFAPMDAEGNITHYLAWRVAGSPAT